MGESARHPLAQAYLWRLRDAARGLPAARRDELLEEVEAHIVESIPSSASEAEVRQALDRLGDPEAIVAEEQDSPAAPAQVDREPPESTTPNPVVTEIRAVARRGHTLEWIAIALLLVGGFIIPVFGWFAGVVLLWISNVWSVGDKLLGTLVFPGGLAAVVTGVVITGFRAVDATSCFVEPFRGREFCPPPGSSLLISLVGLLLAVAPILVAIHLGRKVRKAELEAERYAT
jgi:uncharacterized membrane protein